MKSLKVSQALLSQDRQDSLNNLETADTLAPRSPTPAVPPVAPLDLAAALGSTLRIRQSLDPSVIFLTTVSEVRRLLQVERVFLFQFRPDWSGTVVVEDCALSCFSLQGREVHDPCFAEQWVEAYKTGRVQAVSDIYGADLSPCYLDFLASLQIRANLVVPLLVGDRLWGLLVAQNCTAPRPWQADEIQMMQQLAMQVGSAIQQADLYQQIQIEVAALKHHHLESLGTLAGGLAQDLSEILAPIMLAAEMLGQPTLDTQKQQQWLNRIKTSAHRGSSLVDQVLSFARSSGGQQSAVQIAYVLGELAQVLQEMLPDSISVITELHSTDLWTVEGDASQLEQIFMNLCINAREAMTDGGQIQIQANNLWLREPAAGSQAKAGPYVVVTIRDTGTGMAPDMIDRIFEPFFTTRSRSCHSGLGLSTVLGLVKSHGGWLEVQSQLGRGTAIQVYLPATPLAAIPPLVQASHPLGQNALVLLVLEAGEPRELLRAVLTAYEYQVLVAEQGVDAIALYIQHQAELAAVVLDLTLPTLNSQAMLAKMHQINPGIQLITVGDTPDNGHPMAATHLISPMATDTLLSTLAQVVSPQP